MYVGLTNNLRRRLREHQQGKEKTTRAYRPFALVHFEEFPSRQEARGREKYLKSGIGKEWLKTLISTSDCKSPDGGPSAPLRTAESHHQVCSLKSLCPDGGIGRRASLRG